MLVLFVMSVTGAAACNGSSCNACKTVAKADKFNFNPCHKCGNVLSNDKGCGLKVTTTGNITTATGGNVTMKSNGRFCYNPASCSKTGTIYDSFTYNVVNKYGNYSTANVTIKYRCRC